MRGMAILKYLGPFLKDGRVGKYTTVSCQCVEGGKQWQTEYRTLQRYGNNLPIGSVCRICSQNGKPISLSDIIKKYPRIIGAESFGRRGGITSSTHIIFNCRDCDMETTAKYSSI